MSLSCWSSRRSIKRAFAKQCLGASAAARLLRHLRGCPACAGIYSHAVRLERLISTGGENFEETCPLEFQIWADLVIAASKTSTLETARPLALRHRTLIVASATTAAVFLLLAVGWWLLPKTEQEDPLRSRGQYQVLAVRAFCEQTDDLGHPSYRSISSERGPQDLFRCPTLQKVRFAYMAKQPGFLYAMASDPGGHVFWLESSGPDSRPVWVEATSTLQPLKLFLPESFPRNLADCTIHFLLARSDNLMPLIEDLVRSGQPLSVLAGNQEVDAVVVRRIGLTSSQE